jgi:hypothetical protein
MIQFRSTRDRFSPILLGLGVLVALLPDSRSCWASLPSAGPSGSNAAIIENKPKPSADFHGFVGEIMIFGNEVTPDSVVLHEVPFYPGQRLCQKDLQKAKRNLDRLGLFQSVTFLLKPNPNSEFGNILIVVREQLDVSLRLKLGTCLRLLQGWRVGGLPLALISEGGSLVGAFFGLLDDLRRSSLATRPPPSSP